MGYNFDMAVPAYTTDLITIVDFDGTPSTPTVAEPTTGWTAGRTPVVDTDFPIQSTNHCSETMNTTGKAGALCTNASTFTWTSGNYLFGWIVWLAPGAIATRASGGLAMLCGSSTSAYKVYYVGGSDFGSYPYGGWQNFAVDPTMTYDEIYGSPTTYNIVGGGANVLSAVSKGNPLGFDVFRYGRGEFRVAGGQSGNYATFAGMATTNDNTSNKWGLFQAIEGGYKFKGLMVLGYGSLTNFVDSNRSIVIDNALYVQSDFNKIEIRNTSSIVTWTNINISSLGTVSRGNFVVTDNATINLSTCVFNDMGTFTFQSNTTISNCTFRRCNLVTRGNAAISYSTFDSTNDATSALTIANPTNSIVGCEFISSGTKHAITITATGTYTFTGNTFTGYATSNGSTGNEVIYNNSGGAVTIQHSGTTGTISYQNNGSSTTTVTSSVAITITVKNETGTVISGAYVYIFETNTSTEVMNTTTNVSGIASGSYAGSESAGTIRVRLYGYKPFTGSVNLSSTVDQGVTLVSDPVQDASPQNLSSYYTINTSGKTITSVGSATYTVKEYFKWLANTFAAAAYMQYSYPMEADTTTVFRFTNSWAFGTPATDYKYLKTGAITSSDGTAVWSNIYSIGTQFRDSQIYIVQNSSEITPWWGTGNIDVIVNTKTGGSLIDSGLVSVMSRDSDCLYDHNIVDLSTGGRTPVGINTFEDLNYKTTGDIYLTVASVSGFTEGNYAYGNTSAATGRIQYVDTTNVRLYLCQVEGTFTTETIYQRTSRTGSNDTSTTTSAKANVIAGYTDIKYAFVQRKFSGGTTSGGPFQFGETLTQAVSGWTGRFIADSSNVIYAENTSGTPNATGQLTGGTSGAHYTPTSTSAQTTVSLDLNNGDGAQPYGAYVNCAGRSMLQSYQYLKYVVSHNSGFTINGDAGEEYRSVLQGTYSDVKQAPLGTFAGGKFFGARGVWITNMASADSQNYILTDSNNVTRTPPVVVPITVTVKSETGSVIQNARVAVYRTSDMLEILNTTTNSSGVASTTYSYTTDVPVTLRVRMSSSTPKYIPVNTSGTISSSGFSATVTFIADNIAAATTNGTIAANYSINTTTKAIRNIGTTIYTVNDLYTYLMDYFDESTQMVNSIPMSAQTPSEYTMINGWFIDHGTTQYLSGGAIQTSGWETIFYQLTMSGTPTNPVSGDIGKTVQNTGATHTGILLDYTTTSPYVWCIRAVTGVFTTEAVTISGGTGAGTIGSVLTGDAVWSNIYTLGSLVTGTTLDVYQNDVQITPWWSSGQIDILMKVKAAGVLVDSGNITVLARLYGALYDHFLITAASGRNPVPLAELDDGNNDTASGTVGAYAGFTFTFGYASKDLKNGNGAQPYDCVVECNYHTVLEIYEYLKYVTRSGSSTTLNGVNGEYYTAVGDVRFNYDNEGGGGTTFSEGELITGTGGGAPTGYLVSLYDAGSTGTMTLRNVHGTFTDNQVITGGTTGRTAQVNGTVNSITAFKQAPFGTYAGGRFFGARGVWLDHVSLTDVNNYELIDSAGVIQVPPPTVWVTVNGVVSGDRVSVFRALDTNGTVDKTYIVSHASSNTSSSTTWTASAAIPADTPASGFIRLVKTATKVEERIAYTSWSGAAFTLSTAHSGGYGSSDTAYVPYLDDTASDTSMTTSVTYVTDRYISTRVRHKGIQPYNANTISLTSSGYTATATRIDDTIVGA